MWVRAVADNQPGKKQNRVNEELSKYAERLRRSMTSSGQGDDFDAQARRLFALQFACNEPYRVYCEARGRTPMTTEDWRAIPCIPAAAFKELDLTSLPMEKRTAVFLSSGTTERERSRHFHSQESLELYAASLWRWFSAGFLEYAPQHEGRSALLALTPAPQTAPNSSLVYMFETVRREMGASAFSFAGLVDMGGNWLVDVEKAKAALAESVERRAPLLVLGTAFGFVHLMDHLAERGIRFRLPTGSRVLETGGYKGRSRSIPRHELHALIAQGLGLPLDRIVCEYGMAELSSQAYALAFGQEPFLFRFPPWARALLVSPETGREVAVGETGLIRVFDLANVFSVMAIQTEDLGRRHEHGFELLGRAVEAEPRGCSLMAK